ncbi:hypothetical protein PR048_015821 [Dryococelus australis]|uniref:Uncharacterized protein n=1 Tax=Dryococelus australis TaxID=614101 RepID=A0ABQ9HI01_9NEOP|nr:hypothetical protein PR048_015821 [Dryococelus australis]
MNGKGEGQSFRLLGHDYRFPRNIKIDDSHWASLVASGVVPNHQVRVWLIVQEYSILHVPRGYSVLLRNVTRQNLPIIVGNGSQFYNTFRPDHKRALTLGDPVAATGENVVYGAPRTWSWRPAGRHGHWDHGRRTRDQVAVAVALQVANSSSVAATLSPSARDPLTFPRETTQNTITLETRIETAGMFKCGENVGTGVQLTLLNMATIEEAAECCAESDELHAKLHLDGLFSAWVHRNRDPVQSVTQYYMVSGGVIVPNTVPPGREFRWRFADILQLMSSQFFARDERSRWLECFPAVLQFPSSTHSVAPPVQQIHFARHFRRMWSIEVWAALNSGILTAGEGKQRVSEKTSLPSASSGKIPTCEKPGETPPGIVIGSPWWNGIHALQDLPVALNQAVMKDLFRFFPHLISFYYTNSLLSRALGRGMTSSRTQGLLLPYREPADHQPAERVEAVKESFLRSPKKSVPRTSHE